MNTPYELQQTSIEAFLLLLEMEYTELSAIQNFDTIENLYPLMEELYEDYKEEPTFDLEKLFLVGKHLSELGKYLQTLVEDDAKIIAEMADENTRTIYGNKITLRTRNNWEYPDDDRLSQLESDYKAIGKARTSRKKKLRDQGLATKKPTYSLSVSKK
jgi:hypothetical protein